MNKSITILSKITKACLMLKYYLHYKYICFWETAMDLNMATEIISSVNLINDGIRICKH